MGGGQMCGWGVAGHGGWGLMGHKVWPVCVYVWVNCVYGEGVDGAQNVTSVCLDTETWGLTDDKVTTGLADGWKDALYLGGGGGGWIVKSQSVTSVCCIQTGTWGLVDVRIRGVCQMDGGGGWGWWDRCDQHVLNMEPGAQWILGFGRWMGRYVCVGGGGWVGRWWGTKCDQCMLGHGTWGPVDVRVWLMDGQMHMCVGVGVCVCVGGGDGAPSLTSVCMLREWNLGPYELWVRLRVGLFQKGEEWKGYMTMSVWTDLVFGGIIQLMCVFDTVTPLPPKSPLPQFVCVCVHVI